MSLTPKYPNVEVALVGQDGNAFFILGKTIKEMRKEGVGEEEIDAFKSEATSGDYDNLLKTVMRWVNVV